MRKNKRIKFDYATKYQINQIFTTFFPIYDFNNFYKHIQNYKLTISQVQEYFINNIDKDTKIENNNLIENINDLTNKSNKDNFNLYN